jgi:uncharacterized protein (TIGR02118 family)
MVTLIAMLKRKAGLSHEEFEQHWRDRHGPLIASIPDVARHVGSYSQYPRAVAPGHFTGSSGFDGVTVMTFESLDAFEAFISEPSYAEVHEDERLFLDLDGMVVVMAGEQRVII